MIIDEINEIFFKSSIFRLIYRFANGSQLRFELVLSFLLVLVARKEFAKTFLYFIVDASVLLFVNAKQFDYACNRRDELVSSFAKNYSKLKSFYLFLYIDHYDVEPTCHLKTTNNYALYIFQRLQ